MLRLLQLFKFRSFTGISGDAGVPQKVLCSECSYLLYEGDILKSPQDIIKKFDGRCPKCNRKLNFSIDSVTIAPCEDEGNR